MKNFTISSFVKIKLKKSYQRKIVKRLISYEKVHSNIVVLPYRECIHHIEAVSCHFNELTLRLMGTKMVGNNIIHILKSETRIPSNDTPNSQLADYFKTLLSVMVGLFRTLNNVHFFTQKCNYTNVEIDNHEF